jgi:hypothetical protein
LRAKNRRRKRRLLSLAEADPAQAAPGLAVCRGLDAAYDGDLDAVEAALLDGVRALGGSP